MAFRIPRAKNPSFLKSSGNTDLESKRFQVADTVCTKALAVPGLVKMQENQTIYDLDFNLEIRK